jgi:hypothetical protein
MYKIIILSFLFFGSFSSVHAATATTSFVIATTSATTSTTTLVSTANHDRAAVEQMVKAAFLDAPVMIEVAHCESNFRQFTDAGTVLRGGGSGGMIGVFQFYEAIHSASALRLGFDINTAEGNIGYAKHVYQREGAKPWASCVPNTVPASLVVLDSNKELQIKLLTKIVELLTELLKIELVKQK